MDKFKILLQLSLRNIWRNSRRSLLTIFAVAMGVWSSITLSTLARGFSWGMAENAIKTLTGHIHITTPLYRDDPSIDNAFDLTDSIQKDSVGFGDLITARIIVPGVVMSERDSFGTSIVGIAPDEEQKQSFLKDALSQGEFLKSESDDGVIVGEKLLSLLQTKIGKRVVLLSQGTQNELSERGFIIKGVFKASLKSTEQNYIFVGRKTLQKMLHAEGKVTELSLLLADKNKIDQKVDELSKAFPNLSVRSWGAVTPFVSSLLKLQSNLIGFLFILVFVAVAFGVINTMVMAVYERLREFGLLLALGMKPSQVITQVAIETLTLTAIGFIAGNICAFLTYIYLDRTGIDISSFARGAEYIGTARVIFPVVVVQDLIKINIIVCIMGVLSGIYPSLKAGLLKPIEALKAV